MNWLVRGITNSLEISDEDLIKDFLARKEVREDHKEIAHTLIDLLQRSNTLSQQSIVEIATLSLFVGYYYRVFLEQNIVEVIDVNSRQNSTT
jgi:hypothetical protein